MSCALPFPLGTGLGGGALLIVWLTACGSPSEPMVDAGYDAELPWGDVDGDGISDEAEGRAEGRDSDGDGQPDYLDLDSDDNGIPDATDGTGDFDIDGIANYADLDDGDDLALDVAELAGLPDDPIDSDGDGQPNFRDPDSDNDLILDGHEIGADTDRDGLFDHEDLDSDGDGAIDRDEAGDDDLFSPPVDTDLDLIPDFRDVDSDGDGLSDAAEGAIGTDRVSGDSDGDGVSDLIEVSAGTDPLDPESTPLGRRGYLVRSPACQAPVPERLEVRVEVTTLPSSPSDVSLLFDPIDPEATGLHDSIVADPSGAGCADRTAVGPSYLAAENGDTLCFAVVSRENRTVPPHYDLPQVFIAALLLRESATSTDVWSDRLYYSVPAEDGLSDPPSCF